jgi:hypothetical protein
MIRFLTFPRGTSAEHILCITPAEDDILQVCLGLCGGTLDARLWAKAAAFTPLKIPFSSKIYKITFVNLQNKNKISKDDFVLKIWF